MTFSVTILGNGSAVPAVGKHHAAHALNMHEQFYLIDCGEGTQLRLMECGINPMKINAVFITHMHGDHMLGLLPLLSTLGMMGRKTPLRVFGPAALEKLLATGFELMGLNLEYEIHFQTVDPTANAMIYQTRIMEVWSVPLRHRVPCAGFLFREKEPELNVLKHQIVRYGLSIAQIVAAKRGEDVVLEDGSRLASGELTYAPWTPRSYAYLSDTLPSGKAARIVSGVDLLYHEATFAGNEKVLARETGHTTSLQAGEMALKAGAGHLLIGHFSTRYKDPGVLMDEARTIFHNTDIAREGEIFAIAPKLHTS